MQSSDLSYRESGGRGGEEGRGREEKIELLVREEKRKLLVREERR